MFGDDRKLLQRKIKQLLPKADDGKIYSICNLRYKDWGRLSREFLTEIYGCDTATGEKYNLIIALWETNKNLMELLSDQFTFGAELDKVNAKSNNQLEEFSYDNLVKDLYVSPAIKRSIWQTLVIANEIMKITGKPPTKIFVEVARSDGEKKPTKSRKNILAELYKNIADEERDWFGEISSKTDGDLRRDRLYLYYTQMGRCMYCGKPVEISEIGSEHNLYDIDHILPQSKVKDDSLQNRVLTCRTCNSNKSDTYPLQSEIRNQMRPFWSALLKKDLINKTKFDRLNRNDSFTDEELSGFIARQLVETSQSTKAVAAILKQIFPESGIVYVKAGNISEFRNGVACYNKQPNEDVKENRFLKIREINDYHHAKDAFLNIVVGNVYDTKFTQNPTNFINKKTGDQSYKYNLKRMYEFDVERNGLVAWKSGVAGTMAQVKKTMASNRILFTRYAIEQKGGFYKQKPSKAGKNSGLRPLKTNDQRLLNTDLYGGFDSVRGAYFFLVEHVKKQKGKSEIVRTVEHLPIWFKDQVKGEEDLLRYCLEELKLSEPKILLSKMKFDYLLNIDGYPMYLSGRTGNSLIVKGAVQLNLPIELEKYIKNIVKYMDKCKLAKELVKVYDFDRLNQQENLALYDFFTDKLSNSIYSKRLSKQGKDLLKFRDKFDSLTIGEQAKVLFEALHIFKCDASTADLSLIGGGNNAGKLFINKNLAGLSSARIIHQSPTGIFQQEVDLIKL